jgi:DNA repair exonuclease SbcCD ATPase subunit
MINVNAITVKNFMSVGNQTQAVQFNKSQLTLVLGQNLDLGGDDVGARNGTGKTTIVNALSYALYGEALTKIRKDNLINKTNNKSMLVTVEFEKDGVPYKIERGRKPNILKYYVNDEEQEITDEAQGDSRLTQEDITKLISMSPTMFKHILALNTYTEPFLAMKPNDQREVIEQLLGITLLSEKSEALKELQRATRDEIKNEEYKIDAIKQSNTKIQETIDSTRRRQKMWRDQRDGRVVELHDKISVMEQVDIDKEIANHKRLDEWNKNHETRRTLENNKSKNEMSITSAQKQIDKITASLKTLEQPICPTCDQAIGDEKHQHLLEDSNKQKQEIQSNIDELQTELSSIVTDIKTIGEENVKPNTHYDDAEEAYNHKSHLSRLRKELDEKANEQDPYGEQIEELEKTGLQDINYTQINRLQKLQEHQDFLYKLLTSKDSFVRKRIIDQNLQFLNQRLQQYLLAMGLPHQVVFQNDLTVEITELGRELDFDNLSRGERNRLILGLSWTFRDVWENLYHTINLLFIDELIDNGLDANGVENAISILKNMARERKKNIFLISHKDELQSRVNNVLTVVKENGYTSYANDVKIV